MPPVSLEKPRDKSKECGEDILTATGHHMKQAASLETDTAKCTKTKQNVISENIRQQCLQFLKDKLFSKLTCVTLLLLVLSLPSDIFAKAF